MLLEPDTAIQCPFVVGRAEYLSAFDRVLQGAAEGRGRVVTIGGEAGIGKSRLVRELQERARASGAAPQLVVMQGQCFERDETLPYAPLLDLMRSCIVHRPAAEVAQCIGEQAPEVVKLLPELAARLPEVAPSPSLDPEQEKRRAFDALTQVFVRLARGQPLMLVFEDLHWSDDTSLEFLQYLARRVASERVLVLLTYRSDEITPPLDHFLAGLDRARLSLEWPLTRLTRAEVGEMVAAIFVLDRAPRAEFIEPLFELTEGNPFFIEEVLKSMVASGDIFYAGGGWDRKPAGELNVPRSVQDAVRQRSAMLSEACGQVLVLAAVAGRRFDFELLARLSGRSEGDLLPLVKELMAAQLVVEESHELFAFRHALTQQAIYSGLLARERRALHLQIAEALRDLHEADDESQVAALANHYYDAAAWEQAFAYARRAGERAQRLYAPSEAAQQLTRALDAASHGGIDVPAAVYCARGSAHESLGDFDHARDDYQAGLENARKSGDTAEEWQALIRLGFLWAIRDYERTGEYFRRALDLARAGEDERLLARSLNRLGNWLVNVGRPAEGIDQHRAALEIVTRIGDRQLIAETEDLLGMASGILGDAVHGSVHYRRAIALFRELGDDVGLSSSLTSATVYASGGHADVVIREDVAMGGVLAMGQEALEVARRTGSLAAIAYAQWVLGVTTGLAGRFSDGLKLAFEGLQTAEDIGHEQWMCGARFHAGQLLWLMLDPQRAAAQLEVAYQQGRTIKSGWWTGNAACYLALSYVMLGDIARGDAVMRECAPAEAEPRSLPERRLVWAAGEVALASGDAERALEHGNRLLEAGGGGYRTGIPRVQLLRGRALVALGRPEEALAAFETARQSAMAREEPSALWEAHCGLGRLHTRAGRAGDAAREFAQAQAGIEELARGIDDPEQRARFLSRAGEPLPAARPRTARQAAKEAAGGLTEREREVAARITLGRSNREIAEDLVLSERTIETHVGNILSKLGFTSRAQIAAWGAERGLRA